MKMYVVLLIFVFVRQVDSLKCHKCHSEYYTNCDDSKELDECLGHQKQCYWLIYTDTLKDASGKTEEENGFRKGCSNGKTDCQSTCQWYFDNGYKDCKVKCCDGNFCNDDTFKEVFDSKSKRDASIQYNGAVACKASITNNMLMIFLLVFSFAYVKSNIV